MENSFNLELTSDDPDEIGKLIDRYLEELGRISEQMDKDWEVIDRNTAETWAILAHLQNQMQKAA